MNSQELTGKVSTHLVETFIGTKQFLIHHAVVEDLLALRQEADHAGFDLCIASGFRDFERQAWIWNRKMSGQAPILSSQSEPLDASALSEKEKIDATLRWSALPGASRHHWGTDFDLYDALSLPKGVRLQLEPWEYLSGHQSKFYQWLAEHLHQFGFFFPYREDKGGVAVEPWHISHERTSAACLSQLDITTLAIEIEASSIIGKQTVLDSLETIYNQYIRNICQR